MANNSNTCNGLTVVIVEDEAIIRDLTACELADTGFDVVEFATGEDALPYLRLHGCDLALVITDVQMPGNLTGLELAAILDRIWPDLRVLVTSGGPLVNPATLPHSARFIAKPWRPAELAARAKRMVEPTAA